MTKTRRRKSSRKPRFSGVCVEGEKEKVQTVAELAEAMLKRREELAERVVTAVPPPPIVKVARTIRYPMTWWDHVKQDLFPTWALLRWPAEYTEHTYWEETQVQSTTYAEDKPRLQ